MIATETNRAPRTPELAAPPVAASSGQTVGAAAAEGEASAVAPATLEVRVLGTPAPQGSKRAFRNKYTGRIQQVESSTAVKPWREAVKSAAVDALDRRDWHRIEGAADVVVWFIFARRKGHYGSGRNAHLLRATAPLYPVTGPDVDKLARATLDALTEAGVWRDDKLVVHLDVWKIYESSHDGLPGARITIREMSS